jgi:hypothetical protein
MTDVVLAVLVCVLVLLLDLDTRGADSWTQVAGIVCLLVVMTWLLRGGWIVTAAAWGRM